MYPPLDIVFLKDHSSFSADVAELWHAEWGNDDHEDDVVRKQLSVRAKAQKGMVPFVLIALSGNELMGTASAFESDLAHRPELSPWLAAVVTRQQYRGMGVAEQLSGAVVAECKRLGYRKIYLRTEKADQYFSRLGWKLLEDTEDEKGVPTRVYVLGV